MSSIITHIYISEVVRKKLGLTNKFVSGSILPDMIKIKVHKKIDTHYMEKSEISYKNLPNLNKFLTENKSKLKDEVMLGYYAHLIEDRLWFDKYVDSFANYVDKEDLQYVIDGTIHDLEEFRKDIYADYANMDCSLVNENNLDLNKYANEAIINLKEYEVENEILDNVRLQVESRSSKLKLLTRECINEYLNEVIKEVEKEISKILEE